jgi:beta-lactam-binding protein with PASTA domain
MPNVLGKFEADAWQAVVDAGLTPHVEKGKGDKCVVVDEKPVAGTHLPPGTQVTIVVGKLNGQCA